MGSNPIIRSMTVTIEPKILEYLENIGVDVEKEIKLALKENGCTSDVNLQMIEER